MRETDCKSKAPTGPLFVIGVWRSGTSLLYALLNQHPDIALLYESDLPLFGALFAVHQSDWPARWDFWNSALQRHGLTGVYRRLSRVTNLKQAAETAYQEYAARKGARIWGDKSPTYPGHARRLAEIFPDAKFLLISREPADICRSIVRAGQSGDSWFSKPGILERALFNCEALKQDYDWLSHNNFPVHLLGYDQLVSNPEGALRPVCAFLGISFDAAMTSLAGADRSAVYEGEHHASVKSTTIRSAAGLREDVLNPELTAKIQRYINLWGERYGRDWPAFRLAAQGGGGKPGIVERTRDRLHYRFLRALDATVRMVYCFVPLGLLNAYRHSKRPPEGTVPKVLETD